MRRNLFFPLAVVCVDDYLSEPRAVGTGSMSEKRSARVKPYSLLLFAAVFALVETTALVAQPQAGRGSQPPQVSRGSGHRPDVLLLKLRETGTAQQVDGLLRRHGAEGASARAFRGRRNRTPLAIQRWWRVKLPAGQSAEALARRLARESSVEAVELDQRVTIALTPNDPRFAEQWALHNTGQTGGTADADIDAPEAWDITTGTAAAVVAVIDSGVDYTHPDLAANIWTNPGEIPGNGIDDDGNGYVDDVHGYDFANDDANPMDDHGHGTHVAGTIAAIGNNGVGVIGVAPSARVMAVKFLNSGGSGFTSDAVDAILYATNNGATILSNSWGGGGYSQALRDAIAASDAAGTLFVVAAGNNASDNDFAPFYPAGYDVPNVVAVAATDHNDARAGFSNWGRNTVHLAAPGASIVSTVPPAGSSCCSSPSGYMLLSGTSMAAPHVSGVANLILAQYPGLTSQQIKARLLSAVDPTPQLANLTISGGRLNALNTLEDDGVAPDGVTDLAAGAVGPHRATLTWTASGDEGGIGQANRYEVRYWAGTLATIDEAAWATGTILSGTPRPQTAGTPETFIAKGLVPETGYTFALKVFDNVGNASPISNVIHATTASEDVVFLDDMENGPSNWTIDGSDGAGGAALWHLSTHRAASPTTAV